MPWLFFWFFSLFSPQLSEDLLFTVQVLRQVRLKHSLEAEWKNQAQFQRYLRAKMKEEFPPEELALWQAFLKRLGLFEGKESLSRHLLQLYAANVVGYYDPEEKKMYLIQGAHLKEGEKQLKQFQELLSPSFNLADFFLAHEIVHALQDQQYNLLKFMPRDGMTTDEQMARLAVVEGDATLIQLLYLFSKMGVPEEKWSQFLKLFLREGEALIEVKLEDSFFLALMLFPYKQGIFLASRAYLQKGIQGIEELYKSPPQSTEQVLHGKESERSIPLPLPFWDPGKEAQIQDTLGEFFWELFFQFFGNEKASSLAFGWGNDRLYLFASPFAFAWEILWDSREEAQEFQEQLRLYFDAHRILRQGNRICLYYGLKEARLSSFRKHCQS